MRKIAARQFMVLLSLFGFFLDEPAQGMGMRPIWLGTPFMEGWVPERAEVVRGVLVLDGWPFDGRWQEAAAWWHFAILRINSDKYGSDLPADSKFDPLRRKEVNVKATAVAEGLRRLAEATGHPEIRHVPMVSSGFSRYSGPAASYMTAFPEQALCFMNGHGGGGSDRVDWKSIPSLGMQCEWENIFSGGDKTQLLDDWWRRAPGNLATAAIHWRVYHSPKTHADLGIVFIDQVIKARVPVDWDPRQGPCVLRPVREAEGWVGSHAGWRVPVEEIFETDNENAPITPFADFKGDPERSSWLISKELAWTWRAFSSRYPLAQIVAPGTANIGLHQDPGGAPVGHLECGLRVNEPFEIKVRADVHNLASVELFAYDVALGRTTQFVGGEMALGSTRNAVASLRATLNTPGVTSLMGRYTTQTGISGWTRPLSVVVWDSSE